ncbi:MAG TPA: DUF192 domain-containing protein [Gemmatimonadaceae bacterium]|nr:DUF192 domain-containing protein [Gemmatimonadaceae bacterium]
MTQRFAAFLRLTRALVAAALLGACADSDADTVDASVIVKFDTATVYLSTGADTMRILAEVARTGEQKTMGLMERRALSDSAGMLFLYDRDQPPTAGFWMFRTRIPLDIAFADATGRIVAIRQMQPCDAQLAAGCPTYAPDAPYRAALEVNAGLLTRRGIRVGSVLWTRTFPQSGDVAR